LFLFSGELSWSQTIFHCRADPNFSMVACRLWTISVAAIFYGVSLRGVNRYWVTPPPLLKLTNLMKDGVKITPDWAFYLCVLISVLFFMMAYLAFGAPTS
jgi:hypothetical protein